MESDAKSVVAIPPPLDIESQDEKTKSEFNVRKQSHMINPSQRPDSRINITHIMPEMRPFGVPVISPKAEYKEIEVQTEDLLPDSVVTENKG